MRRLTALLPVAIALALRWSAPTRAQSRGKEIVVGLGAEPRTMLAVTIVDWTTNNMLEHMYDRLLDRDAKTFKPRPMLAESWRIVNDTTWEFKLRKGVKFHNGEPFTPESSARMAALLAGEIDIMKDVPPHAVEAIEKSGRATLRATVSSRINYLALVNLKPGPMQDLRVRRAMNHAVDVDELIKQVLKGRASRMCGPLAPANVDYAPAECYKYDPARAQALFKDAGVDPKALNLTLDTPSGRYPLDKDVSLAIAAQLQRLGIKTNVVVNEWGTHLDKIKNRNTGDLFFL